FLLSARTRPQLGAYARDYVQWLTSGDGRSVPLAALAWQLQTGRQAMEERLALVAADHDELVAGLRAFCDDPAGASCAGRADPARFGALTGGAAGQAFLRALAGQRDLQRLALLWLSGAEIDWSLLQDAAAERPQRIAAPTYPFARHRYWIPEGETPAVAPAGAPEGTPEAAATLLAPSWRLLAAEPVRPGLPPGARLLVVGARDERQQAMQAT